MLDAPRASALETAGTSCTGQQYNGFDRGDGSWGCEARCIMRWVSHPFEIQEQRREVGSPYGASAFSAIDHSRCILGGATAFSDGGRFGTRKSTEW